MMRHLDEATIQAYLDGELTNDAASAAASHLAGCEACAAVLSAAGSDSALFAAAFAPSESIAVPSEMLRARINAAVARLEEEEFAPAASSSSNGWSLGALIAPFRNLLIFTPQRTAAFAGLCAVLVFAVLFAVVQRQPAVNNGGESVETIAEADAEPSHLRNEAESASNESRGVVDESEAVKASNSQPRIEVAGLRGERKLKAAPAVRPRAVEAAIVEPESELLLPVEKNYQDAIASLTKAVEAGGDRVMNPKERFEYERNLALLDQAIAETRRVALRDPKDSNAVGFLISAYQSKVEMLTTVADQTQVAAIGR